jgi:hypothetical protein
MRGTQLARHDREHDAEGIVLCDRSSAAARTNRYTGGSHLVRQRKPVTLIDDQELALADENRVVSLLSAARSATSLLGWDVGPY